ncbi:MAG: UbiH/UbiF/VisC/COQ6 family ubiquinone biosynthesis hydroxylase [Thiohalomonadaceae bacterium]
MDARLTYDIIIVGGGLVGATLACALGDSQLRVAVVEPMVAPRQFPADDFDNRVSAISRATQNVFIAIDAWEGMLARRVQPYTTMQVWDVAGGSGLRFECTELAQPDLGHIIENRLMLSALLDRLETFSNIELLCPASATGFILAEDAAELTLADGRSLSARLLVGTDGAGSWVREQAGIDSTGWCYDQSALATTVTTSRQHEDTASQVFHPTGPLALLPLSGGHNSAVVWSTSHAQAEILLNLPESEFLDELQHAFGDRLGRMTAVGRRAVFPLCLSHADQYVRPRLALAGNAAHVLHPLAGQGLNIGVLDVAALAEVLLEAGRRDIGGLHVLRRYERWRKGHNIAMVAAMDVFKRLFSNDNRALALLRNTGLQIVDRLPPLKNSFMRQALGLTGDLPAMARSVPDKFL